MLRRAWECPLHKPSREHPSRLHRVHPPLPVLVHNGPTRRGTSAPVLHLLAYERACKQARRGPQVEFGAIFRSPKIDRRLKYTLNRLRRGAETHRDFSGVALLEAHPFLSDPDLMAQGAARHRCGPLWFTTTSPLPPASAFPSLCSACHVRSPSLRPVRRARVPWRAQLLRRPPPRGPDRCRRRLHRGARVGASSPDPPHARRPQPARFLHLRAVDRLPARMLPRAPPFRRPSDSAPSRPLRGSPALALRLLPALPAPPRLSLAPFLGGARGHPSFRETHAPDADLPSAGAPPPSPT